MKKKANPWQNGLLATSALAAVFFSSTLLWQQGHPEWAFLLAFSATWTLISISWSNVDYTEQSGSILARIVDHNFNQVHERLEQLERELKALREKTPGGNRQSN
ncbi:MAG: hypothetical protein V2I48_05180 [Xanthomonadales bacterium]|jgi:hypothetical protein|nr:hypothetical protein [Xanthomonadales bacterium]